MTRRSDDKLTVRVEVVIEGGHLPSVVTSHFGEASAHRFRNIVSPTSGGDTPVRRSGGQNFISANGGSPVISGHFPRLAWALAYNVPNVSAAQHPSPGPGAVNVVPDPGTGSWSFGQVIPGACCNGTSGDPDNSTLLVWYDYAVGSAPASYLQIDQTNFHGYCPGGSGILAPGIGIPPPPAHVRATTLHATFHGALSTLGTVMLAWNGVSWTGQSAGRGAAILSFQCRDSVCQLLAAGPGTAFVVAAQASSYCPFNWSASDMAVGTLSGRFQVTITE